MTFVNYICIMIFQTPQLSPIDEEVIALIQKQRLQLQYRVRNGRRWTGWLRRNTMARVIQGSNSIEGYNANLDVIQDVMADAEPEVLVDETLQAINGYRNALTYILQASQDPFFEFSKQFLKSLHFMMVGHEMNKNPGQWRRGAIRVVKEQRGSHEGLEHFHNPEAETVYQAPDAELVDGLIDELVAYLKADSKEPSIVRAAMAHLNLVMIHPFSDGNGRMSRALQTLTLARGDGILSPVFCSIEEWLGRNTQAYYDILAEVGQGAWHPENNALPWVRFCLKAHYQQAATIIRRDNEYEKLYSFIEDLIKKDKLNSRFETPLFDAARGYKVTRTHYMGQVPEVSEVTATRDLQKLVELGWLIPHGERRGRWYMGSEALRKLWHSARLRRPVEDPYDLLLQNPTLPGLPNSN